MKTKIFLSSILTIALCLSLIVGSTFALFNVEKTVNIAVTAGKVDVEANIVTGADFVNGVKTFENGGTASIVEGNTLQIDRMTPGDSVTFNIQVANKSNVKIAYKVSAVSEKATGYEKDLSEALECTAKFTFNGVETTETLNKKDGKTFATGYCTTPVAETVTEIVNIEVTVTLPITTGNEFQGAGAALTFKVEAVQGNGAN